MKILVATFRFLSLTGTETFTYTLLKTLKQKGLRVSFYSPFLSGPILKATEKLKLEKISDKLSFFKKQSFDLIHCHHSPTAILLRHYFPEIPMVYLMHGPLPFLEQPPDFLTFNYYGCLSEEIKDLLKKQNIPLKKLFLFPNSVDTRRFSPSASLPKIPHKLMVISNHLNKKGQTIAKEACNRLNLEVSFIGKSKAVFNVEKYLKKTDIVLSLGRGIIEALSSGKAALVFGLDDNFYKYGDGMITKRNIKKLSLRNFSGRTQKIPFTVENLVKEIKKYNHKMGEFNRNYSLKHFDFNKNIEILIKIYKKAKKERVKKFDKKRVAFEAKLLEKVLDFEKLAFYQRDFKKLLITRFKDQLIQR